MDWVLEYHNPKRGGDEYPFAVVPITERHNSQDGYVTLAVGDQKTCTDEWIRRISPALETAPEPFGFAWYQHMAMRTANDLDNWTTNLMVAGLGLGEAGEVQGDIKKAVGQGHPLDPNRVKKELGDLLWYITRIASLMGYSLEDVAIANIRKLELRYPEHVFSSERSSGREDYSERPI